MSLRNRWLPPILAERSKKKDAKTAQKKKPAKDPKPVAMKVAAKKSSPDKTPVTPPLPEKAPSFGTPRLLMAIGAFVLAGIGQSLWMRQDLPQTISRGWIFFIAATVLLLLSLVPWKKEASSEPPFPATLEKWLVGGILLVAAFFRVFRLDEMPPGVFIDQGICGNIALQIRYEGARPIFPDNILRNPPYLMYQLAIWFTFFKATAANFFLFFGLMSVGLVGFAYWTFRQLAGVRVALVAAFILSVMAWNVNFSRNGFPTIEVPFYMFATMAFLFHGLSTRKRWPFVVSALFFSGGMYTYQAYKIFPLLLLAICAYEIVVDRQRIKENLRNIVVFTVLSCVLITPFLYITLHNGNNIWREQNYNIISQIKTEKSWKPAIHMVTRTAKMFNREGDSNERHNYPNHRMLDNITAALFALGLFYSLFRFRERPFFFVLAGFFTMSLPCLFSQDPAHANRMLGTTPFIALLAALPVGVLWSRIHTRWGVLGDILLVAVLVPTLSVMGRLNYDFYFNKLANFNGLWTTGIWAGYSVPETKIGQAIAEKGDAYDYLLCPRFDKYPTVDFLAFKQKERLKRFVMPEDFAPLKNDGKRGNVYVLMREHEGLMAILQELYPGGKASQQRDLAGNVIVNYFTLSTSDVQAARGVEGTMDGVKSHWPDFPNGLATGSHRFVVKGCLFVEKADTYTFSTKRQNVRLTVANNYVSPGQPLELAKGFYAFEASWQSGSAGSDPGIEMANPSGQKKALNATNLTTLPLNRGLKGTWYRSSNENAKVDTVQWNQIINFPHGGDFNFPYDQMFVSWEGILNAPETGLYQFATQTDEYAFLSIDGAKVFDWGKTPKGSVYL